MANIAPDNGGTLDAGGLQRLPFQDPSLFTVTPQKILAQAQAQGQLGQLSDQLALEKAQRTQQMAATNYQIAATQHLQDNLPTLSESDKQSLLASIAASKAANQGSTNTLTSLATAAAAGAPVTTGLTQAADASNALATATANRDISSFDSITQGALSANATAVGSALGGYGQILTPNRPGTSLAAQTGTNAPPEGAATPTGPFSIPTSLLGSTPGAQPPAPPASVAPASSTPVTSAVTGQIPSFLGRSGPGFSVSSASPIMADIMQNTWLKNNTTEQTTSVLDESTGQTHSVVNRVGVDGKVYSSTDLGVIKAENASALRTATKDLENLVSTAKLADNVQTAYDAFDKAYPDKGSIWGTMKRMAQSYDATMSTKPITGSMSIIEKGIGAIMESPETANLVAATQNLNQSLSKVDGESAKQLSGQTPSAGDLTNPEVFLAKLNGTRSAVAARMATYKENNVSGKLNPGSQPAGSTTAPAVAAPAATAVIPSHIVTLKNGQKWSATLNSDGSYTPISQIQ